MKCKLLIILGVLASVQVWAAGCDTMNYDPTMYGQGGYEIYSKADGKNSYECNVEMLCSGNKKNVRYWDYGPSKYLLTEQQEDPAKHIQQYPNLSQLQEVPPITQIQSIYEATQNRLINCAVLRSKYTLHTILLSEYDLFQMTKESLNKDNKEIMKELKKEKCILPQKGDTTIFNEQILLDSFSYEQCMYSMYLHYFNKYKQSALRVIATQSGSTKYVHIGSFSQVIKSSSNEVDQAMSLARRTGDTALKMYEEYDRTYIAHVLLDVISGEWEKQRGQLGGAMRVMMKFIRLINGAQVSELMR